MKVVSNASPLVNLGRIGRLDLLREIYGELLIADAVWQEVVVDGAGQPGSLDVKEADWIRVVSVANRSLVQSLRKDLDAGEAEAIALALEIEADLLLMDERLGREIAQFLGLRYTGLIGSLVEAKHRGIITTIKTYLDQLRSEAGFCDIWLFFNKT